MKLLIATLILSACAFAQATTITIQIGAGAVQTFTVPAAGTVALNSYLPSQTNPDGSQRYATIHALIIGFLKETLFRTAITANPPAAIVTKRAAIATAEADLAATLALALP